MTVIVGMKYRIKRFDKRPKHWNSKGLMDNWMGKIVEVTEIWSSSTRIVKIKDDATQWNWKESDFKSVDRLDDFGIKEEDFIL